MASNSHSPRFVRWSGYFAPTLREEPGDAEVVSHRLMLKAGMIRKVAAGIYDLLPLGLRGLRKVEAIVREEMDRAGAHEVLLPMVTPAELWQETGRWDVYGKELLRFQDRHERWFCLGPTHEEVITDLVRREVRSHRQLPITLYQIQTKFRDEVRPRFGLMRGREFMMKDAYSFDRSDPEAEATYGRMREAYDRVFARCGLRFTSVEAATGAIGGSFSHEYMVLAESGEDQTVSCSKCGFAANIEFAATAPIPSGSRSLQAASDAHPGGRTLQGTPDALPGSRTLQGASASSDAGSLSAPRRKIPRLPGEPSPSPIEPPAPCPKCSAPLSLTRGIEVGHVFKLGEKYSKAMKATFLDAEGKERTMVMGCYGIGIGRTFAAAIEQGHDENGPILPPSIAPFHVLLTTVAQDPRALEAAESLAKELNGAGIEVLWDDRDERAGVKFKDGDLTGIPVKIVVGKRFIEKGTIEIKPRRDGAACEVPPSAALAAAHEFLAR